MILATLVDMLAKTTGDKSSDGIVILSTTTVPDGLVIVWRRWATGHKHEHRMTLVGHDLRVYSNMMAMVTK